jgi:hypothetical protein
MAVKNGVRRTDTQELARLLKTNSQSAETGAAADGGRE